MCLLFFFFSSRRRHTRCSRDWSSDVCSSDLAGAAGRAGARAVPLMAHERGGRVIRKREPRWQSARSEEHTSELQSRLHLVCRLLLEKKKKKKEKQVIDA